MNGDSRNGSAIGNEVRTQQALHASELSYRRLFEAAQDGILILDFYTGSITDANPFLCKLLGFSLSEMVGYTVAGLSPFKDMVSNQAMLELLQKHGYVRYEDLPLETKDGRKIAVEFVSNVYQAGDKKVIQCNIRDITERKRAEATSIRLASIVESSDDAIISKDFQGIVTSWNAAAEKIFGYQAKEMVGQPITRLFPRNRLSEEEEILGNIRRGKSVQHRETVRLRKDGTPIDVSLTVSLIKDSAGRITGTSNVLRNITERKSAEAVTRKLLAIIETSLDLIGLSSLEGSVEYLNPEGRKMVGLDQEKSVCSTMILDYVHETDRERFQNQVVPALFRDGHWDGETVFKNFSTGAAIPTWQRIFVITEPGTDQRKNIATIVRDITERKRIEVQIAEQARLLDVARDGIMVRDFEGKILYWNKGAERMYGWTSDEAIGRNVVGLFQANPQKFEKITELTIKNGEWQGEVQHLAKDRHEITSEAHCTLIRDNEGRPESVLSINADITEKKKLEAQYLRAQRMESIGTLAGGVAHDLNNILAPIMMSIDILKTTAEDPQAKKILETIEISAKRGADIVRQVLSFARGVEGERIEVQPKHLLQDLENIIKDTFPKDIRLQFSIPNDIWTILGDPTQVHQILLNLCINARDAMPHGGSLTIGVENCVIDEQYAGMNIEAKPGRYAMISVTDSGTGMTQGIIDRIFDPFFTTKELNKGTGLGLSTVMTIVKSHEGFINVYSEPGNGTTFKVYLPAMELSSETRMRQTQLLSPPRGKGETVLVIDDEASILTITSQTLQAFGYRVLTAKDGADALAVYTEHKNEIAVVLTDMAMPVMDGSAMIHALMRINPTVKVIAASGLNATISAAKVAGVKHFLTKPYTAAALLKTLRAILDEA